MNRFYLTVILLIVGLKAFAQNKNYDIVIVQKSYSDTLLTNYDKDKFEINLKTNLVTITNYSSPNKTDTTYIANVRTERFGKSEFDKKRTIGDTIFDKYKRFESNDTVTCVTKKVYGKHGITYAARIFPNERAIPYNELKYQYDENGNLIQIFEKYNSENSAQYKTIFDYKSGIVSRMNEYKSVNQGWKTEKKWDYNLLQYKVISLKVKKRINSLLIDKQFKNPPW